MNEFDVQNDICAAVVADGGVALKLNGKFLKGIPDLYINLTGFVPLLTEVKMLRGKKKLSFSGLVGLSPWQYKIHSGIDKANSRTSCTVALATIDNEDRLYLIPATTKIMYAEASPFVKWAGKATDIRKLFSLGRMRRIRND
jgi:hypothetical protein